MIVDLTARFDYDTGWSYLFIVYCRSGRFGQSSCFGHVTVHSQLGFDQLELCLTCPKKANCRDLAAQAEVAGRRARGQIPFLIESHLACNLPHNCLVLASWVRVANAYRVAGFT